MLVGDHVAEDFQDEPPLSADVTESRLEIEDDAQCCVNAAHLVEAEEPDALPSRPGSIAAACSASTRVFTPPISISGRKLAARAAVDVGATSQVDRGSWSDWTTTA